jgi:hypothetical protein
MASSVPNPYTLILLFQKAHSVAGNFITLLPGFL